MESWDFEQAAPEDCEEKSPHEIAEGGQMSAHCEKHGCDIVYPSGTWPLGVCPVCEVETKLDKEWTLADRLARLLTHARDDVSDRSLIALIDKALAEYRGPQKRESKNKKPMPCLWREDYSHPQANAV